MSAHPLEARIAHLEGAFEQVTDRLNGIDRRLGALGQTMKHGFGLIDQRVNWVIGTIVGTWVTTILAVLLHR